MLSKFLAKTTIKIFYKSYLEDYTENIQEMHNNKAHSKKVGTTSIYAIPTLVYKVYLK